MPFIHVVHAHKTHSHPGHDPLAPAFPFNMWCSEVSSLLQQLPPTALSRGAATPHNGHRPTTTAQLPPALARRRTEAVGDGGGPVELTPQQQAARKRIIKRASAFNLPTPLTIMTLVSATACATNLACSSESLILQAVCLKLITVCYSWHGARQPSTSITTRFASKRATGVLRSCAGVHDHDRGQAGHGLHHAAHSTAAGDIRPAVGGRRRSGRGPAPPRLHVAGAAGQLLRAPRPGGRRWCWRRLRCRCRCVRGAPPRGCSNPFYGPWTPRRIHGAPGRARRGRRGSVSYNCGNRRHSGCADGGGGCVVLRRTCSNG